MARPRLDIGTYGKIAVRDLPNGRKLAVTRYRDIDGITRSVERTGPTKDAAIRSLKESLKTRSGKQHLSGSAKFAEVAEMYLDEVRDNLAATTGDAYTWMLRKHVIPALGQLSLREITPGHLNTLFTKWRKNGLSAGTVRCFRKVIAGTLQVAIDNDLLSTNPVRDTRKIKGGAVRESRDLDMKEVAGFLAGVDADEEACRYDLPALIRFMAGTGDRIGEALAVRWRDLNLSDHEVRIDGKRIPPRSVWINGNIVRVKGAGLVRHPGKTEAANRIVGLPEFLVTLLLVRRPADVGDDAPVFGSQRETWQDPATVHRRFRQLCDRLGYEGLTWHSWRHTVITLLDEAGLSARQIADIVGHTKIEVTLGYMGRGRATRLGADALDAAHAVK